MNITAARKAFRSAVLALSYDNASKAVALAAIHACTTAATTSPAAWVAAAERASCPCRRCAGTGQFVTMVLNGVPTGPGGICFRCDGRGFQNAADGHRNRGADKQAFMRACQLMMAR